MATRKKKEEPAEPENKTCFIISPLGPKDSVTRRNTDGLINHIIRPVLEKLEYDVIAPHEIDRPGSITNQVVKHLLESEMVIANLSNLNANVMYELAVRHAKRLPVVCICEDGTVLPFDIATERVIHYANDIFGVEDLKNALERAVGVAEKEEEPDNPIYRVAKDISIMKQLTSNVDNADSLLYEKLSEISSRLDRMESSSISGGIIKRIRPKLNHNDSIFIRLNENYSSEELLIYLEEIFHPHISDDIALLKVGEDMYEMIIRSNHQYHGLYTALIANPSVKLYSDTLSESSSSSSSSS